MLPQLEIDNALHVLYWSFFTFLLSFIIIEFILIPKLDLMTISRESNSKVAHDKLNAILLENDILLTKIQNVDSDLIYGEFHKNCEKYYALFEKDVITKNTKLAQKNMITDICNESEINMTGSILSKVLMGS